MTEFIIDTTLIDRDGRCPVSERVVRCKDCRHFGEKGWKAEEENELWEGSNAATDTFCHVHSSYDFEYDYSFFWYVKPDDFCSLGVTKDSTHELNSPCKEQESKEEE